MPPRRLRQARNPLACASPLLECAWGQLAISNGIVITARTSTACDKERLTESEPVITMAQRLFFACNRGDPGDPTAYGRLGRLIHPHPLSC